MRSNLKKIKEYLVDSGYDSKHIYLGRKYDVLETDRSYKDGDIILTSYNGYSNHNLCDTPIITGYVNVLFKGGEFSADDSERMDKLFKTLNDMRNHSKYFDDKLISLFVDQPFMEYSINERNNIFYYMTLTLKYTI